MAQPQRETERQVSFQRVESTRVKNIVFAPSILEILANNALSILTTTAIEGKNVVPLSHAGEDGKINWFFTQSHV